MFIRESWYAAIWSVDLGSEPVKRTILNEEIVFYRGAEGQPLAVGGVCPHRFASLAKGRVHGDTIACPYHGLRFGADGRCVYNPNGPVPSVARIKAYPFAERHGMIWIWMGLQEPDLTIVPDVHLMDDHDSYTWIQGTLEVKGNYQLIIDNLLDLTHVEFMHPFLAAGQSSNKLHYEARQDGETVFALYEHDETATTPITYAIWESAPSTIQLWAHIRWDAPSNLYLESGFSPVGSHKTGEHLLVPTYHLLTPETGTTTHYFWSAGRNMKLNDQQVSEQVRGGIEATFMFEDEPMIADIQNRIGDKDLMSLHPLLLSIDNAAVRARRVITNRLATERAIIEE